MKIRYTVLNELWWLQPLLKVEAKANCIIYTPGSFPKKMFEQLRQFGQRTFQNVCAASTAKKTRICSLIVNKGEEGVDKKFQEDRKPSYTSTFNLLIGCVDENENM